MTPVARLGGRDVERAALGDAFNLAASGRLAIIILEGEGGIGKTSLLGDARRRGWQVFAGRAEELERTRPFGALSEAFRWSRSSLDPRRTAVGELLAKGRSP
jgi:predicted ATPase